MKRLMIVALLVVALLFAGCIGTSQSDLEQSQQASGVASITQNQPVPDLGGYSFERQIVIETYIARNKTISTYSYMFTMDGKVVEICSSIGYPIPYSTQLTNGVVPEYNYGEVVTVDNPEPNGLYPPGDAAATLVQCVNPDGSVTPVYIEWYVLAFPYQIESDIQLQRKGDSSFSVQINQ